MQVRGHNLKTDRQCNGDQKEEKKKAKNTRQKLKIDQPEAHRPQKKIVFNSGEVGEISEKIFNGEPIIQGSGCKHAINQ